MQTQRSEQTCEQAAASLVGSDRVEGTPVFRPNGDRIGRIKRIMLDKRHGTVAYAVLAFGGFLGVGDEYYPIPWARLQFSEDLGGYEIDIADEQLRAAPHSKRDWDFGGRTAKNVIAYYDMFPDR